MIDRTAWVLIEAAGGPKNQYHLYHGVEGSGFGYRGVLYLTPAEVNDLRERLAGEEQT